MSSEKLDLIKIVTDGREFVTTKTTLMRCPYFENFFSECSDSPTEPIHLDCSGEAFAHILEYLRFPTYRIPDSCYYLCDFFFMEKNPLSDSKKIPGTLCYYTHNTLSILDAPSKEGIQNVAYFIDIYRLSGDILLSSDDFVNKAYGIFIVLLEKSFNESVQSIFNDELIKRFGIYYESIEDSLTDFKGAELYPFFYDHPDRCREWASKQLKVSNTYGVRIVKAISKTEHAKAFVDNIIRKLVYIFNTEINRANWSKFVPILNEFFRETIKILESHERWYEIKYRPYKC